MRCPHALVHEHASDPPRRVSYPWPENTPAFVDSRSHPEVYPSMLLPSNRRRPSRDGDEGGDGDGDDDAAGDKDGRGKSPLVGVKHLTTLSDHSKYVVACRWAPDGSAFATASHDKVVTLYVRKGEPRLGVGSTGYEKVHVYMCVCVRTQALTLRNTYEDTEGHL